MTDAPERITIARKVGSSNTWDVVGVYSERVMSMGYIGPVLYARADLAPQWHRMDDPDNPPPKCQPVLADYGGVIRIVSCSFTTGAWCSEYGHKMEAPKRWMPLPTPPEATP